jgi:hypothetical protein
MDDQRRAEFELLQYLRVRGVAERPDVDAVVGDPGSLERALAGGAVLVTDARDKEFLRLDGSGEARRLELLAEAHAEADLARLEAAYADRFLPLNVEFKDFCTRWQATGDRFALLEEMIGIDERTADLLAVFEAAFPHYRRYRVGFEAAMEKVESGDVDALTGALGPTYHNLWFELHEDLLRMLGRSRADEEQR